MLTPISRRHPSLELSPLAISYVLLALYLSLLLLAFTFCANSNAISFNTVSITLFPLHSDYLFIAIEAKTLEAHRADLAQTSIRQRDGLEVEVAPTSIRQRDGLEVDVAPTSIRQLSGDEVVLG